MEEKLFIKNVSFTSRELDVISLIAFNIIATKSIAYILEISPRTVEVFIHGIAKKINCRSRKDITKFVINKKYDVFLKDRYEKLMYARFQNSLSDFLDKSYIDLKSDQEFENLSQVSKKVEFYDDRLKKIMQIFLWVVGGCIVFRFYIFWFERHRQVKLNYGNI